MLKVEITGRASQTKKSYLWQSGDKDNLLEYLRDLNLPVASSCYGEGVCKKCKLIINGEEKLSCQISMQDFSDSVTIEISYL